ncbi:MAG: glycosyltransferase family 4 protein, partial [Anaerolineales bacterium]
MRVGLVTGEYPPMQGGVGDFTQQLGRALATAGTEVHVITSRQAGTESTERVTVHTVPGGWTFGSLARVRTIARRQRLDLLNIQYQAAAYGLSAPIHFLPDVAGVKTVVTFHDLRIPYLFPKAGRLRAAAVTHLARAAGGVIVTDAAEELELRRRGGVARLVQIPIGSNVQPAPPAGYDREAWRASLPVGPGELLLGYFGFLNESKGGDTLISALAILKDRRAPFKLVLIGGQTGASDETNAAFEAKLERMIRRYDLADHIVRTGFVPAAQVSAHLLACDAIVLPYRDGVSFRRGSLMAALAHGCAIITTEPKTPMPDVRDGVNLRLVPPNSAQALVLAISGLLDAPALRARLGQGARELAQAFSWDTIARRTLDFYQSVAGAA